MLLITHFTLLLSSFIPHNWDLWSPAEIECMTAVFIQLVCLLYSTLLAFLFLSFLRLKWRNTDEKLIVYVCVCVCVCGMALITILTDQHDEERILLKHTKVNTGN